MALSFNGTTHNLVTASDAHGIGTGDFSWGTWVQTTENGDQRPLFVCGNAGYNTGEFAVQVNRTPTPDEWFVYFGSGGGVLVLNDIDIYDGLWHHIAFVRHNGLVQAWTDGRKNAATLSNSANVATNVYKLMAVTGDGAYTSGKLQDMWLCTRAVPPRLITRMVRERLYAYPLLRPFRMRFNWRMGPMPVIGAFANAHSQHARSMVLPSINLTLGTAPTEVPDGVPLRVARRRVVLRAGAAAQAVSTPAIAPGAVLWAPSAAPGAVGVSLPAIAPGAVLHAPAAAPGAVGVALPAIAPGAVLSPTSAAAAVALPAIAPGAVLRAPSAAPGAVGVSLPAIPSGAALFAPEVVQAVSLPALASASILWAPAAAAGALTVSLPAIAPAAVLWAPAGAPGAVGVSLPALPSAAALWPPSAAAAVSLPAIAAGAVLHAPTLAAAVSLPAIGSGALLWPPAAEQSGVGGATIPSGAVLWPPAASPGAVAVSLPFLPSAAVLWGPAASEFLDEPDAFTPRLVALQPWSCGPNAVVPMPGEDGLALLIPAAEPLSAGLPPVAPALARAMVSPWPVRRAGVRSGQVAGLATDVCPRTRWTVSWIGLEKPERDAVLAFLRDGVGGTRFAFDLAMDGPGGPVVPVRPLADARDSWETQAAYRVDVEVEEVY